MDVTAYKFDVYIEMNIKYLCQYYFELGYKWTLTVY